MDRYDHYYHDSPEALGLDIDGTQLAWTADDEVYLFVGDKAKREDGFDFIGTLTWEEADIDTPIDLQSQAQELAHNIQRLRDFYFEWKRGVQ